MKRLTALMIVLLLLLGSITAYAANAGSPEDPLISLDYVRTIYMPSLLTEAKNLLEGAFQNEGPSKAEPSSVRCPAGTGFTLRFGGLACLQEGTASLQIVSGTVLDLTAGVEISSDTLRQGHRYLAAEDSEAVITLTSAGSVSYEGDVTVSEAPAPVSVFSDVPPEHWAFAPIEALAKDGYINGVGGGLFAPGSNITRADFVTILGRISEVDPEAYSGSSFEDVPTGQYYSAYVEWATQLGVVNGYGNGSFGPRDQITRSQMAAILVRYAAAMGIALEDEGTPERFADDELIEDWAYDAVYAARTAGLLNGREGGVFAPQAQATRAEVCMVLYRMFYE